MNQEKMNQENRVLGRIGARELTPIELGRMTDLMIGTPRTFDVVTGTVDGDLG